MESLSGEPRETLEPGPRCLASWSSSLAVVPAPIRWVPLGSAGGFSGSALWRGEDRDARPRFALKQWPDGTTVDRLTTIHFWLKQASNLPFVPSIIPTNQGATVRVENGRVWELVQWMPGEPGGRVEVGCQALSALHHQWRPKDAQLGPMPAIRRRLQALADWKQRAPDRIPAWLQSGKESVRRLAESAERSLHAWESHFVPLQPCLCDCHRDHLLFARGEVTGVVDFGAMKMDHVSVDLARYLGDAVEEDEAAFLRGLIAYGDAGGDCGVPSTFVRLLDRIGAVCSMIGWLMRLGTSPNSPSEIIRARVSRIVARLERIEKL